MSDITLRSTRDQNAVLVQSRFCADCFNQDMYQILDLSCPASLTKASHRRRAEFLAGRVVAQTALIALDIPTVEIPVRQDRVPCWPARSSGSISHSQEHCACFVIADPLWTVGIDVEIPARGEALDAILGLALTEVECSLIMRQQDFVLSEFATLLFSAKETLFKALYPLVQYHFSFEFAEMRTLPENRRVRLYLNQVLCKDLPRESYYDIQFEITPDFILTWCAIYLGHGACSDYKF